MDTMTTNLVWQLVGAFCGGATCLGLVVFMLVVYSMLRAGGEMDNILGQE
jgi:formate/nitrite transporter FocA (FNT family)